LAIHDGLTQGNGHSIRETLQREGLFDLLVRHDL
jgi:hypothetical protein